MACHKVLAIGLDGYDFGLAERYMAEGQMPALAELRKRSARFLLDEGLAQRAGLPWEHVATGLSPEAACRWSQIYFDPHSYTALQAGARLAPWWAGTDVRVVVFDTPFVDLCSTRNTQGVVGWGSHNPGTLRAARPTTLVDEFLQRFGDYPASDWIYGSAWPSASRARKMGKDLCHAVDVRGRAAGWLATERFPEWDLFFVVFSELHSGAEGLWHGVDPSHPLNKHPSAAPAATAMLDIHRSLDQAVERLVKAAGDAIVIMFNMGGMGPNKCDVPSMVLLPELLYRHAFGQALLKLPPAWTATPNCLPILNEQDSWDSVRESWVPQPLGTASNLRSAARRLPEPVKSLMKAVRSAASDWRTRYAPAKELVGNVDYIPAYRYRHHWPRMPAFALPAFGEGRIRINLRGRERHGFVELSQYEETCRMLETLLGECRDSRTGEPMVAAVERSFTANPMALAGSDSDLVVSWRGVATGLEHPRLGLIGPVPLRRTGGHTGNGIAYLAAPGLEPGERGARSSSDIAPTLVHLLGAQPSGRLDGKSLL